MSGGGLQEAGGPSLSFHDGLVSGSLYTSGGGGVVGPDSGIPLGFFFLFSPVALDEYFESVCV